MSSPLPTKNGESWCAKAIHRRTVFRAPATCAISRTTCPKNGKMLSSMLAITNKSERSTIIVMFGESLAKGRSDRSIMTTGPNGPYKLLIDPTRGQSRFDDLRKRRNCDKLIIIITDIGWRFWYSFRVRWSLNVQSMTNEQIASGLAQCAIAQSAICRI